MPTLQIFLSYPSSDILFNFLVCNSEDNELYFIFSKINYKKALFNGTISPFLKSLEPYYYLSKKHYVNRKMDYNKFITVIRQLCNVNNINYEKKMVYNNSTYDIVYYICKNKTDSSNNILS